MMHVRLDTALPFGEGTRMPDMVAAEDEVIAPRPAVLAAMHGILTGGTRPEWPWRLAGWAARHAPTMQVVTDAYWAWPLPRINYWRNNHLARRLANRLSLYAEAGFRVHLVGHSNGACVCLRAVRYLAAVGIRTESLQLIGAAIESDIERNGLLRLLREDRLGRVRCDYDRTDRVLGVPAILRWPYGDAGRTGLLVGGADASSERIANVRNHGYGHSGYFEPENEGRTYAAMARFADVESATPTRGGAP